MLIIGIDEAGYGPKLGPLCHGYAALRCADGCERAPDLWKLLSPAVRRHPARNGAIAIDDSKKIFAAGRGLSHLVRGVNAFFDCVECADGTTDLFCRLLPDGDRKSLEEDPWAQPLAEAALALDEKRSSARKAAHRRLAPSLRQT